MSKQIITAIDFSDVTKKVLSETVELAQALELPVILVHVFQYIPETISDDTGSFQSDFETQDLLEKRCHKELEEATEKLTEAGVTCRSTLLHGSPANELLQFIEKSNPRVVILGSHGHGALYHLVLGGVSEKIVDRANCSVYVVKK